MSDAALLDIEPLVAANTNQGIQDRLMRYIGDRKLKAGDRMPSQAVLAQALGVSLVTLREAMRAMEALGIIEARAGSGWYVCNFSFASVARGLAYTFDLNQESFADLTEIRIRLECSYLPEAMRYLNQEDLDALEASVTEMEQLAAAGQEFDAPDRAFHMRLFSSKVQNRLFSRVMELFWAFYPQLAAPAWRTERAVLVEDAARHRLILEALCAGDTGLAVQRLMDSLQGAVRRTAGSGQSPLHSA
jgi:DNA-binding FadR family transcriptional regulator